MNTDIQYMLDRYTIKTDEDMKNVLIEIVQEIVLLGLSQANFFKQAAFYGGSSLRLFYGLDRFSEDLDFTALTQNFSGFSSFQHTIETTLDAYGLSFEFKEQTKTQQSPITSAFIKETTYTNLLSIGIDSRIHPQAKSTIKIEIDTQPAMGFNYESKLHLRPQNCYISTLDLPSLCAGKLHALLFRQRTINIKGRDWYDFAWFMAKEIPYNYSYLTQKIEQTKNQENLAITELETITFESIKRALETRINQVDFNQAKNDIRRFLPKPQILDFWSKDYFLTLLNNLSSTS